MTVPVVVGGLMAFQADAYVDLSSPPLPAPVLGGAATTLGWTFLTVYVNSDATRTSKQVLTAINLTASTHQVQISVNDPAYPHVVSVKVTPGGQSWASPPGSVVDDLQPHFIVVQVPGPGTGYLRIFVDGNMTAQFLVAGGVIDAVQPTIGALLGSKLAGLLPDGSGGGAMSLETVAFYAGIQPVQGVKYDGAFPQEQTGERFHRALNMVGHPPTQRDVANGTVTCATDTTDESQTKVLTYLQKIEATEQGQCYVSAGGLIVFRDRNWRAAHVTSAATFSDRGAAYPADLPYAQGGVTLNFDRAELFNEIPVRRRFSTAAQIAVDQPSQAAYTQRTMPGLSDLLMASDSDALACATFILNGDGGSPGTKSPQYRVGDLVLNPLADNRLWPLVLGLDIGDVITVIKSKIPGGGAPISLLCRIEGIEHQGEAPASWQTTFHVSLV